MNDKQIEKLFSAITNFADFQTKVSASEDISLDNDIRIHFEDKFMIISFSDSIEKIPRKEFEQINEEIKNQHKSDVVFNDIIQHKRTRSGISVNIRDNNTFLVTDEYIKRFMSAPGVEEESGWYGNQLKELIRLFDLGYAMVYNDLQFSKQEFMTRYFRNGTFSTLESEYNSLQGYTDMH